MIANSTTVDEYMKILDGCLQPKACSSFYYLLYMYALVVNLRTGPTYVKA